MKEAPEGIVFSSSTGWVDTTDLIGTKYPRSEVMGLSKNQIETLDLISEGPILGLKSGIYVYSGIMGEIGWRSAIWSGYLVPTGYSGVQFLRSVYWNEIPVLGDEGLFNFQSINIAQSLGTPNGQQIQTLSPHEIVSRTIGERLLGGSTNARAYRIFNTNCRATVVNIKIPGLVNTNPNNGNIERTSVSYKISYRPIFYSQQTADYILAKTENIFGKVTAGDGYKRATRVDFNVDVWDNPNFEGWEIKIERITPDSTSSLLSNLTYVDSITEIQGNIFTYPNSAMVKCLFDAEFFRSVPERFFEVELKKIKIPGNYDPILRNYSITGFATTNSGWNGQFATGLRYTNNPAWCYYDLITNKRYGLGKYITEDDMDKFGLYKIGQYCDTLVSNGYGDLEPRFSCNMWFINKEEAYKMVNDMASIFRGLTYYAQGTIFATQDAEKTQDEIRICFTNANVEEGNFNYQTASKKTRYSIAIVRYNDPKNFYKPSIEYVENFDAIRKYGVREIEVSALGCTSRGQAIRVGRWILSSNNLESETIKFVAGMEATALVPGDVFKVFDRYRKVKRYGGRTVSIDDIAGTGTRVILDSNVDVENNITYNASFVTPTFNYDSIQITGLNSTDTTNIKRSFIQKFGFSGFQVQNSGDVAVLNIYSGMDYTGYNVSGNPVWIIELSDDYSTYTGSRYFTTSANDYYRAINIRETDVNKYEIEGLQYNPQKYGEIESGLLLEREVLGQTKVPVTPHDLNFNVFKLSNGNRVDYSFLVDDFTNINSFRVYAKNGDYANNGVPSRENQIAMLPQTTTNASFYPFDTGIYNFRVYSSNDVNNILSPSFAQGAVTIYDSNLIGDVIISTLQTVNVTGLYSGTVNNNNLTVIQDNDTSPIFTWQVGYNGVASLSGLNYRVTIRNYNAVGRIPTDDILYEVTGITDQTWTFGVDENVALSEGPYRDYQVVVEAHNEDGNTSAGNQIGTLPDAGWSANPYGYDILAVSNPRQTGIELSNNLRTLEYYAGGVDFNIITGDNRQQFAFTGSSNLFVNFAGTGIFSGSGTFTTQSVISNYYMTGSGLSYVSRYTGISLYTGYGSFYSGHKFLGANTWITGTSKLTGVHHFIDTGKYSAINTDNYGSIGYVDLNGGVSIRFTNGVFDEDLVGAYIYVYTGQFPKLDAAINLGHWGGVQKTEVTFDPVQGYLSHPMAAFSYKGAPYLYASASFFDSLDKKLIDKGIEISTGLYISNNAILYNNSTPGTITVGGLGTILTVRYIGTPVLDISNKDDAVVRALVGLNDRIIEITNDGVSISVIYYVSSPIVSSPYGGTIGGNVGGGSGIIGDGGSSLGTVAFSPPGPDSFISSLNVTLTIGGSATRIHYFRSSIGSSPPTSYSTYIGTSVAFNITSSRRVWARASDGSINSTWQYADYTEE